MALFDNNLFGAIGNAAGGLLSDVKNAGSSVLSGVKNLLTRTTSGISAVPSAPPAPPDKGITFPGIPMTFSERALKENPNIGPFTPAIPNIGGYRIRPAITVGGFEASTGPNTPFVRGTTEPYVPPTTMPNLPPSPTLPPPGEPYVPQTIPYYENGVLTTKPAGFQPVSPDRPSSFAPSIGGASTGADTRGTGFPGVAAPVTLGAFGNTGEESTSPTFLRKRRKDEFQPTLNPEPPMLKPQYQISPTGEVNDGKGNILFNLTGTTPFEVNPRQPINAAALVKTATQSVVPGVEKSAIDTTQSLVKKAQDNFTKNDAASPIPPKPILDPSALTNNPTTQQTLQELITTNLKAYEDTQTALGIPDTLKDLDTKQKELQSWQQSFTVEIKDIQDNPDFPKRLAERRIARLEDQRTKLINTFQSQIDLLKSKVELQKEQLKARYGIIEKTTQQFQTQAEQKRDNTRNQVTQLITSKAFADISDSDLKKLAQDGGYTLASLQAMRKALQTKTGQLNNVQSVTNDNGDVTTFGFDENNKRIDLGTVKGIGKKSESQASKAEQAIRLQPIGDAINKVRGSDGFVNPQAYKEFYQRYISQNPGHGDDFLKNFPIEIYINPRERYLFSKNA